MNEGNPGVVSPRSGFLIDHGCTLFKKGFHLSLDIIDFQTDMMDPLTFCLKEFDERRVRLRGLNEFNIRFPYLKETDLRLLCGDHFYAREGETHHGLIEPGCFLQILSLIHI